MFYEDVAWRRSWYYQLRKHRIIREGLQGLEDAQSPDGEWYFDKQSIRDFWGRAIRDIGVFHEISREQAMAGDGSVFSSLYRMLGCDMTACACGPAQCFTRQEAPGQG